MDSPLGMSSSRCHCSHINTDLILLRISFQKQHETLNKAKEADNYFKNENLQDSWKFKIKSENKRHCRKWNKQVNQKNTKYPKEIYPKSA